MNVKIFFVTFFLFLTTLSYASVDSLAQISIPFIVFDNGIDGGGYIKLYLGLDLTATDSIDIQLGESDLPPFPPVGGFEARFILPKNGFDGSLSSYWDFRNAPSFPFSGQVEHRLKFQAKSGADTLFFEWNFPPQVTALMQDLLNGSFVNVNMSGTGLYAFTNFQIFTQLKLLVTYNNVTDVESGSFNELHYELEQNYPNPFNPATTINFTIAESGLISLDIYNVLGEKVDKLVSGNLEAGNYNYTWNAINFPSGIYFYELRTSDFISVKKMLLIK